MSEPVVTGTQLDELVPPGITANGALRRLLATSIELFASRGYHGVSVRDITSRMGVKPSSLYAHFASKEELFSQLVFLANDAIHKALLAALLSAEPDPRSQLSDLVHTYTTFHADYPLLATIGHNDLHVLTGDALHRVTESRRDASKLMHAVVEHGNTTGAFRCEHPWLAVAAIASMGIRLAAWYRAPDHAVDPETDGYPTDISDWLPRFDRATVGDAFADYALAVVGAEPRRRS